MIYRSSSTCLSCSLNCLRLTIKAEGHTSTNDLLGKQSTHRTRLRGGATSISVPSLQGSHSCTLDMLRSSDPEGIHPLSSPLWLPNCTDVDIPSDVFDISPGNCCTGTLLDFPIVCRTSTTGHRHDFCLDHFMYAWNRRLFAAPYWGWSSNFAMSDRTYCSRCILGDCKAQPATAGATVTQPATVPTSPENGGNYRTSAHAIYSANVCCLCGRYSE